MAWQDMQTCTRYVHEYMSTSACVHRLHASTYMYTEGVIMFL